VLDDADVLYRLEQSSLMIEQQQRCSDRAMCVHPDQTAAEQTIARWYWRRLVDAIPSIDTIVQSIYASVFGAIAPVVM
jgi:hypothetical protein